jgi:hypothetical protein
MRRDWQRLAALAGVGAVVLWIVGVVIQGEPPEERDEEDGSAAAGGADLLRWYNDETDTILAGGFIFQLGVLLFLIFLVALRGRLGSVEGPNGFLTLLAWAAGIALAVFLLAAPAGDMAGAINDEELTPDSALALRLAGDGIFVGAQLSAALFVAATGLLVVRFRALPVWLGWVSFLLALLLLIPPIGWAGVIFGLPLWLIATSVLLYLRAPSQQVAGVTPA